MNTISAFFGASNADVRKLYLGTTRGKRGDLVKLVQNVVYCIGKKNSSGVLKTTSACMQVVYNTESM